MSPFDLALSVRRFVASRSGGMLALLAVSGIAAGCSGGSGSPVQGIYTGGTRPTATPSATATVVASATPKATATPVGASPTPTAVAQSGCTNTVSQPVSAGGSATLTTSAATGMFTESISGQLASATTATLGYQAQSALAAPLARSARLAMVGGRRTPMFTAGAGNTYVIAFCASFGGATPSSGVALSGSGVVPSTIAVGTQLNIAILSGGTWVDVGTALVNASGNFQSTTPTVALPGINASGTYLVYEPAQGTNTTTINLGFAIVGDDGSSQISNGLQFLQIEDSSGNALPTPTSTFLPIDAFDLDGQALTPDASRGASVDGGNSVYFFSGFPQHTIVLATNTVDVTNYGSDGDSLAILPSGDEVVVSADNGGPLAVISGILSGNPAVADTIAIPPDSGSASPASRDGLVISNDGSVLLSRGESGIDVYKVAPTAAHAGTGMGVSGTTSYSFSLVKTLVSNEFGGTLSEPAFEDGRDGMAISPVDASRAVVVGSDASFNPIVQLLTGLNTASPTVNSISLHVPHVARRLGSRVRLNEPSAHRSPFSLSPPTADGTLYAVSISPNGTTAYVSTSAGLIVLSGVNTGTLAQVGAIYSPALTVPGGTCPLVSVPTIGILPDGKYLTADVNCGLTAGSSLTNQGAGVLVTVPIGSGGALGAPVGQYNNVVTPFNDQMITH